MEKKDQAVGAAQKNEDKDPVSLLPCSDFAEGVVLDYRSQYKDRKKKLCEAVHRVKAEVILLYANLHNRSSSSNLQTLSLKTFYCMNTRSQVAVFDSLQGKFFPGRDIVRMNKDLVKK